MIVKNKNDLILLQTGLISLEVSFSVIKFQKNMLSIIFMAIFLFYLENMHKNMFFDPKDNFCFRGVNKTAVYGCSTYFYIENHFQKLCSKNSD